MLSVDSDRWAAGQILKFAAGESISHTADVVVVRSSWRFGDTPSEPYLATHVWIKRPEGWRLLYAQVAEVKTPDPTR